MGTRSGSLDPGLLVYLLRHKGLTVDQLDHALNHQSGLLGLSGISSDMRVILREARSSPQARLALDAYIHRVVQTVGGMTAVLGGVDALVFTSANSPARILVISTREDLTIARETKRLLCSESIRFAGVGENSAQIREFICEKLGHLGPEIDLAANARCQPDGDIAPRRTRARPQTRGGLE